MKEHKVLPRPQFSFYDAEHSSEEALNGKRKLARVLRPLSSYEKL